MNSTRDLPSINDRLRQTEKLTEADFKAFDFTWEGRDLNKSGKVVELLGFLGVCFKLHMHIEELFSKIDLTIQQLKDEGYLHVRDIDNIAKRIYMLQDAEGKLADDADKKRLQGILDSLFQLRVQMTQPTKVIPIEDESANVEFEDDTYEQETQQTEPYEDTSDIFQKLNNAILVETYDKEKFIDLLKQVYQEHNGNKIEIINTLLNTLQEAEALPYDKPFIQFIIARLKDISEKMEWDQKFLVTKQLKERIESMGQENPGFRQSVYQKLLGIFR